MTVRTAIDEAFVELERLGVVALQSSGMTQSDGWYDAECRAEALADELSDGEHAARESRWGRVRGAVFFHGQDAARARRGEGLYLTFGAFAEPGRERAEHDNACVEVGNLARDVLARHGVTVEWDGTAQERLFVPPSAWRG